MKSSMSWEEYQRLELISSQTPSAEPLSLAAKLNHLWQRIMAYLGSSNEPHVWQTVDMTGRVYWNAIDPLTGRSIEKVSADTIRVWLEARDRHGNFA